MVRAAARSLPPPRGCTACAGGGRIARPAWSASAAPLLWLSRVTRARRSPQVYHSEVPSEGEPHACGCALLPLNTKTRGPAKRTEGAASLRLRPKPSLRAGAVR